MNEVRELKAVAKSTANGVELSVVVPVQMAEDPLQGIQAAPGAYAVWWGKTKFEFSPKQRSVVLAILSAIDEGAQWVDQAKLLEAAESDCPRLRDLFKRHPAWGTMIVPAHLIGGPMGSFTIVDPKDD